MIFLRSNDESIYYKKTVFIKYKYHAERSEITADVNKIEQCASNTTLENTEEPTPSNKDQDPTPKSTKHAMIYIVGISGTLFLVAGLVQGGRTWLDRVPI